MRCISGTREQLNGFLVAVTDLVKREALEEAIRTSVKSKTIPLNLEAFNTGYDYAIDKEIVR